MSRYILCLVLCTIGSSTAQEPRSAPRPNESAPEAASPVTEPPPVNLTAVVADVREVNVKLETVCRMQYGDNKCMSVKSPGIKQRAALGELQ